jgi:TPR repeat protein
MKPGAILGPFLLLTVLSAGPVLAQPSEASVCDPQQEGEGAQWFAPCKEAASKGDGHAALMVGAMYWNGDGVAKDHAQAARWFEIADLAGETRAAKMLGDEAFGRLMKATRPEDTDRAVLDVAIGWYEKAVEVEPVPAVKAQAQQSLAMLSNLKRQLSTR